MYQGKYNLNWHEYTNHVKEMLHELIISEHLTNVTLVSDDEKQFKAHKFILSSQRNKKHLNMLLKIHPKMVLVKISEFRDNQINYNDSETVDDVDEYEREELISDGTKIISSIGEFDNKKI